jgi:putative colanic acid biosynthesis acetyltransferase WcaF
MHRDHGLRIQLRILGQMTDRTPAQVLGRLGTGTKLARLAWGAAWLLLYRPTPNPLHGWRCFVLRVFGAQIAKGAHPYPSARIWAPWNLTMASGSCIGPQAEVYNVARVTLGEQAIVSQKSYLCTAGHDIREPDLPLTAAPIVIGNRAWVAASAFVGPGVAIGEGAVVAACAVVIRNVAANAIVGGNPAKVIGDSAIVRLTGNEDEPAAG